MQWVMSGRALAPQENSSKMVFRQRSVHHEKIMLAGSPCDPWFASRLNSSVFPFTTLERDKQVRGGEQDWQEAVTLTGGLTGDNVTLGSQILWDR